MDEASRDEFLKCFDVYGDVNRVAFVLWEAYLARE